MPSLKKQTQVESLVEQLKEKPNFAVIKFDRTTHTSLEGLRKDLCRRRAAPDSLADEHEIDGGNAA